MNAVHPTRRTLLATGAAAGTAAALSACGAPQGAAEADRASNADVLLPNYVRWAGPTPDVPGSADGPPDLFDHYPADPPLHHTTPPGDGESLSLLTRTDSPIPPGHSRNTFWQALEEGIGSPLDLTIVPGVDWGTKFATICAGGKLPDLMAVEASMRALPQFLAAETIDLQPYLSGDLVEQYPYLANLPTQSWRRCAVGGGLHGIPIPRGMLSTTLAYGRQDLLAERGITELPSTYEDFAAVLAEVNSPQENVFAMANVPLDWLRSIVGVPNGWQPTPDGSLVHSYESDRQEQALETARQLWESGVVHPDAYALSGTAFKQEFGAGRVLIMTDTYTAWPQFYREATQPGFEVLPMLLPSFQGTPGVPWLANATYGIAAVTRAAEDRIETALGVLDYLSAPFGSAEYLLRRYGREGEHHTLDGTDPVLTDAGTAQSELGTRYIGDAPWPIYLPDNPEAARAEYAHAEETVRTGVRSATENVYSETESRQGKGLTATMDDLQTAIITGREPVSAWGPAVQDWRTGGGDTIRAEFTDALSKAAN